MPPKKGKRKESIRQEDPDKENPPEPLKPSFANVPFLRSLIMQGKERVDAWPQQIALALNLNDHYVDLHSSILVDQYFSYLSFALQNHFSAEKTKVFIEDQEHLCNQLLGDEEPRVEELIKVFKMRTLDRTKPPPPAPQVAEAIEAEEDFEREKLSSPKAKDKAKVKPKEEVKEVVVRVPKKEVADPVVYSISDVTNILEFNMIGILQHHRLYRYVYSKQTESQKVSKGDCLIFVETAAAPLPLARAHKEQDYIEMMALRKAQEEEQELARLRDYEEKAEAKRKLAQQRQQEEEARLLKEKERAAHQLNLSNAEAQVLVSKAAADMEESLQVRRQQILERLIRLEEKLGLTP